MDKFKSNPYNKNNKLISSFDIINIMGTLNINNYKINDIRLYQNAFFHKSYCNMKDYEEYDNVNNYLELQGKSYEEMEFLGDSILGSIVSKYLYDRYYKIYNQNEGFLTKLKTRLVCGENLAYLSNILKLNQFMVISEHIDSNHDGRNNKNILEDILEAFIGAIYLDNDYNIVSEFIINMIEKYIDFSDFILNDTNYKEQIIKYLQHNYKENPKYEHINDDDKLFSCKIVFRNNILCIDKGETKKKAEQNVSKKALIQFKILTE